MAVIRTRFQNALVFQSSPRKYDGRDPSLCAIAILVASSDRLSEYNREIAAACSQSPELGDEAAKRLALSVSEIK